MTAPVPGPARAGALIYAFDPERVAAFYEAVLGMQRRVADAEHIVLASADFQLILHAIPAPHRALVVIGTPPQVRERAAIRLFFSVPALEVAARAMRDRGGEMFEASWEGPGFTVRNGCDCEGNVLQLREWRS